MNQRGRTLLIAQRKTFRGRRLPPLGPPPEWLEADEIQAWHDLVAAAPDVLTLADSFGLALLASDLTRWRTGHREPGFVRDMYRNMGRCLIPMRERRRLLFPERQRRP